MSSQPRLKRDFLKPPYYALDLENMEDVPGHDFNREIVHPGENPEFPDGAVGIRIDDDFWTVAALPYDEFRRCTIEELVAVLWPKIDDASFGPDTPSQIESLKLDNARLISAVLFMDRKFNQGASKPWREQVVVTREEWYETRFKRSSQEPAP